MRTVRKNPVVGLIKLLAFLVLLYVGYTEGWPWLKAKLDEGSGGGAAPAQSLGEAGGEAVAEASRCVQRAQEASSALSGLLQTFRSPPYDQAAWGPASLEIANSLGTADSACLCGHPACREAGQALAILRELFDSADGMVRGNPTGTRNLGALRGRADDHLDRARDALRGG